MVEPDLPALTLTTDYARDAFGHIATATVSGPDIATRASTTDYPAAAPNHGRFATTATNALGHAETRTFDARFGAWRQPDRPQRHHDQHGNMTASAARRSKRAPTAPRPARPGISASRNARRAASTRRRRRISSPPPASPTTPAMSRITTCWTEPSAARSQGFDGTPVHADTLFNALGQVEYVSRPYFDGALPADIQWKVTTYDDVGRVETDHQARRRRHLHRL